MSDTGNVAIAGGTGDLGARIIKALVARGATVSAIVRPDLDDGERSRTETLGARVIPADPFDLDAVAEALAGADCVVSALNGVRDVIIDRQTVLLNAAIRAKVPRIIPSDYAADFTKTRPGDNRNFDLRREFMALIDLAPIQATSILNGAFMDMLGEEMPLIQPGIRRVLFWHDPDQRLDFTTKDNVAAYVAAAAMDENTPRFLRIAGDTLSARELAVAMTETTAERYRTLWVGSLGSLGAMIKLTKLIAPGQDEAFPPWQGMQYMRDQFSGRGKLEPLDNARYPDLLWTPVKALLAERFS